MPEGIPPQPLKIVHLSEVPQAADILAQWFEKEWAPWYGPQGPGNAKKDLAQCVDPEALPICLDEASRPRQIRIKNVIKEYEGPVTG